MAVELCAERFDLKPDIQFGKRVVEVVFDDNTELWTVRTDKGDAVTTRFVITAVGALSTARTPRSRLPTLNILVFTQPRSKADIAARPAMRALGCNPGQDVQIDYRLAALFRKKPSLHDWWIDRNHFLHNHITKIEPTEWRALRVLDSGQRMMPACL